MMHLDLTLKYLVAGLIVSAISFSLIEWQKRQPDCHPMVREYQAGIKEHASSIILWPLILVALIIKLVRDMVSK
jgi:hypothetical protein